MAAATGRVAAATHHLTLRLLSCIRLACRQTARFAGFLVGQAGGHVLHAAPIAPPCRCHPPAAQPAHLHLRPLLLQLSRTGIQADF